jgi:hypothetical protein
MARERGSSAPAWTPASLTNLRGWYRADTVTLVGSDVTTWQDQSGAGNDVTDAGVAARRPLHVTAALNGHPVVRFDGGGQFLTCAAFNWGASVSAHTIALVVRQGAFAALDRWVDYANTIYIRSGATDVLQGIRASLATSVSTTTIGTTVYRSIMYSWDGSNQRIWIGGATEDTDANAGSAVASGNALTLAGGASLNAQIDVAEAVVMRAEMTAGERADWAAYVSSRYGV